MGFKFEKLEVWKLSIEVADKVDKLTQTFPKHEIFVLTSQMKRAADSISLNIAEGFTGQSDGEKARFIGYAQRSALEVVNCLYLAKKRDYITEGYFHSVYKEVETLVIKTQSFKKSTIKT